MSRPVKAPEEDVLILSQPGKSAEFAKRERPAKPSTVSPIFMDVSDLSSDAVAGPKTAAAPPGPEPANVTWAQAAGRPEASVHLARLPEELSFGEDFPEPIRYDTDRQLLIYRGFMTSMSCQYLRSLSADLIFLSALDELNVRTSTILIGKPARQGPWLLIVTAALLAMAAVGGMVWHMLNARPHL